MIDQEFVHGSTWSAARARARGDADMLLELVDQLLMELQLQKAHRTSILREQYALKRRCDELARKLDIAMGQVR